MTKSLAEPNWRNAAAGDRVSRSDELKDYEKLLPAEAAFWETRTPPGETKTVWTAGEPRARFRHGR